MFGVFGYLFWSRYPDSVNEGLEDRGYICSKKDGLDYDFWKTTTYEGQAISKRFFYVMNITNPYSYIMNQDDAVVVEQGPFTYRYYATKYNVDFHKENDTVQYKEWSNHVYLPKDSCDGCLESDKVYTLNMAYLNLLKSTGGEASLFLSEYCTVPQIKNSMDGGYPVCTNETRGDESVTDCQCCNATSFECLDLLNYNSSKLMSTLSWLNWYDGGIQVSQGYDTTSSKIAPGQFSPLITTKSPREVLLGHTSAMLGFLKIKQAIANDDVDEMIFIADYTRDVINACSSRCSLAYFQAERTDILIGLLNDPLSVLQSFTCDYFVTKDDVTDKGSEYLIGTSCKPYTSTLVTELLSMQSSGMLCAPESNTDLQQTSGPCCLINGSADTIDDLSGLGCLYPVPGFLVSRNSKSTVDDNLVNSDVFETVQGCLDGPIAANSISMFGSVRNQDVWYSPANNASNPYFQYNYLPYADASLVRSLANGSITATTTIATHGLLGSQIPPQGITTDPMELQLSDGKPRPDEHILQIFSRNLRRPIDFEHIGPSTYQGLNVAQYSINVTQLAPTSGSDSGLGVPSVGVFASTYVFGLPIFISLPLFASTSDFMLSQQDNSHHESLDGNGIELYSTRDSSSEVLVTSSYLQEILTDFDNIIQIEPALGVPVTTKRRLQISAAVWECNPGSEESCKLSQVNESNAALLNLCYASHFDGAVSSCSLANVLTPRLNGGKIIPVFWAEETVDLSETQVTIIYTILRLRQFGYVMYYLSPIFGCCLWLVGLICFFRGKDASSGGDSNFGGGLQMSSHSSSNESSSWLSRKDGQTNTWL